MNVKQVRSRDRVSNHGEVFTSEREVNSMINLVPQEADRPESKFLEPACGNGNFLIEILKRKLKFIELKYKRSQSDYEKYGFIVISSLYGVELLEDNVIECRNRLYDYFVEQYDKIYKKKTNINYKYVIRYILGKNILLGDALTLKLEDGTPITFCDWVITRGSKVKRRDYHLSELLEPSDNRLKSDTNKDVSLSIPFKEYPEINYMKVVEYE